MSASSRPPARISPAARFREQIESAEAEGCAREELALRLTYGDANLLMRDRDLPVADISFAGGIMRFLGVKVEVGPVAISELIHPA